MTALYYSIMEVQPHVVNTEVTVAPMAPRSSSCAEVSDGTENGKKMAQQLYF